MFIRAFNIIDTRYIYQKIPVCLWVGIGILGNSKQLVGCGVPISTSPCVLSPVPWAEVPNG